MAKSQIHFRDGRNKAEFLTTILLHTGNDCFFWPYAQAGKGYPQLSFGKKQYAHRFICELVNGPPPSDQHQAAHTCGNPICVSPHHLEWKTQTENEQDKIVHGTQNIGQRNGSAKLTEIDIRFIRQARGKISQTKLGKLFGVAQSTIKDIQLQRIWKHVN